MTYQELLESKEWRQKREIIVKRDFFKCQSCKNSKLVNQLNYGRFDSIATTKIDKIVKINSFQEGPGVVASIGDETAKYLNKFCMVYYGRTSKGRKKVYGIRKLKLSEQKIFECYTRAIKDLYSPPLEYNLEFSFEKLNYFRERWISELKSVENQTDEFEWHIMTGLHVHHKYYVKNKLPWEYKDEALITLCMDCHQDLHKNQKVPVYDMNYDLIGEITHCCRCYGAGWFPEYLNVDNGICFRCRGAKYEELINHKP